MVLILKLSPKIVSLDIVSLRLWLGMAMWQTIRSSLKGWEMECRTGGWRVVTPLFGVGFCCKFGRAK